MTHRTILDEYQITKFPLPPSVNKLYRNVIGVGRAKGREYKAYENACRIWMLTQQVQLFNARKFVRSVGPYKALKADAMFYFLRERILTKANTPKRNDTSNYLKAPLDLLSQILHVDDCYIWAGTYDKTPVDSILDERVDIKLSLIQI